MPLRDLAIIENYISKNDYQHRNGIAAVVYRIYEKNPDCSLEQFTTDILAIRHDFFRINRIDRAAFAADLYKVLNTARQATKGAESAAYPSRVESETTKVSKGRRGEKPSGGKRETLGDFAIELIGACYIGVVVALSPVLHVTDIISLVLFVGLPGVLCLGYSVRRHSK